MTATPKETKYVSNIHYFGEPVYTYSLKQGIQDGFLAPYKVINVHIDVDVDGYRPTQGATDTEGEEIPDRIYNQKDFDRTLGHRRPNEAGRQARKRVPQRERRPLPEDDRLLRRPGACGTDAASARQRERRPLRQEPAVRDADHRQRSRKARINSATSSTLKRSIPVLVTTSRLLSTGVDAQTCRLIVLDRPVGSMTEFKQILGRGTRVHEDTGKYYFTLMDFRGATHHFADPDFDGEPVQIYDPDDDDPMVPPDDDTEPGEDEIVVDPGNDISIKPDEPESRKIYVNGVLVTIVAERVKYLDADGKLITESLRDYSKRAVTNRFASLDTFLRRWKSADRKQAIIDELEEEGLRLEPLAEEVNPDLDPFDLICHVAYDRPPLTRRERADNVRKRDVFAKYGPQARAVLDALLEKYQDEGVVDLADVRILQVPPIDKIGTPVELIRQFGSRAGFEQAVHELQDALYEAAK